MARLRCVLIAVLLASAATAAAASSPDLATVPISRLNIPWWKARFMHKQAELRQSPPKLVWIGDSITQDWEREGPPAWEDFAPVWRRFYGDRHAINLGFRGDSTCHVLWRLQHGELDRIAPKGVILLIGANNFGRVHTDAAQTEAGIKAILDLLHHRLPATKVLLISVLPSIRSHWVSQNTIELDDRLGELSVREGPWLRYRDLRHLFERHNEPDPALYIDPRLTPPQPALHPTAEAQAALAQAIEPDVHIMMDDQLHR